MSNFLNDLSNMKEPYLIAEIGINHNGDMKIAKQLIDATNACGWHCAKFQKRNPDICVPQNQKNKKKETPWGTMSYIEYKYKMEFGKVEYDSINKYCSHKTLDWTASVWDVDSLEFIINYKVPFIKIPSAKITDKLLLEECAKTQIPLIISSGMSNWEILDEAINLIIKYTDDFAVLHCNSTYPAPVNELNLNAISSIRERYQCIVGYSGHEYDLEPSVLSVALGAKIIERHITLDHSMWGTDHGSSLEIHAMDLLRKRMKKIHLMLGSSEKYITASEIPVMEKLRG